MRNEANLIIVETRKHSWLLNNKIICVELLIHLDIVFLSKNILGEIHIYKITARLKKFFEFADMHDMKSCVGFIQIKDWKMIGKESFDKTIIGKCPIKDFRLVLFEGSTIKLPLIIIRQHILFNFTKVCTTWTKKERAR